MKQNTSKKSSAKKSSSSVKSSKTSATRKSSSNGSAKTSSGDSSNKNSERLVKLFEDILKDTYWAEKQLTKALPKMSKAANAPELKKAFDNHLKETEKQVTRLEQVFNQCDLKVAAKKCEAMEGLLEEGKEVIENHDAGPVRDAGLIISAQKVEHYEIASYGSLRTLANVMSQTKAARLLEETLEEESNADETLTQIAMRINQEAYGVAEANAENEDEDYDDEEEDEDEADDVEMSDVESADDDEKENVEDAQSNRKQVTARSRR